ncbi:unnamed protein product [Pylaiella littoralis]
MNEFLRPISMGGHAFVGEDDFCNLALRIISLGTPLRGVRLHRCQQRCHPRNGRTHGLLRSVGHALRPLVLFSLLLAGTVHAVKPLDLALGGRPSFRAARLPSCCSGPVVFSLDVFW